MRVLTCDPLVWLITALFAVLKDKKNLNQNQINKLFLQAGRTTRIFRKKHKVYQRFFQSTQLFSVKKENFKTYGLGQLSHSR